MSGDSELASCRSCNAPIGWIKTFAGKNIPVDADSLPDDWNKETIYDKRIMKTHFETCPYSAEHKGQGGRVPAPAESSVLARKLNVALATLTDIQRNPPDGLRSQELAKTALSQIRGIR
jgi:hypothetical protein